MIFCVLNSEKIWHQYTCPPHLHTVATLPWEIQKSHFSTVSFINTCTSDYLRYLRRKQSVTPYSLHLKNVAALLCKMHNFFISLKVCCILPNVSGSEKSRLWVGIGAPKRTGCDVWQMECQASNVTANVQSDHLLHEYVLPVFFATDRLPRPRRFRNSSISRIGTRYAWKMKKIKHFCIL